MCSWLVWKVLENQTHPHISLELCAMCALTGMYLGTAIILWCNQQTNMTIQLTLSEEELTQAVCDYVKAKGYIDPSGVSFVTERYNNQFDPGAGTTAKVTVKKAP